MDKQFSIDGVIADLTRRIKLEDNPAEQEVLKRRLRAAKRVKARFEAMRSKPEKAMIERAAR